MAKAKTLVIVANAFDRARHASPQKPARVMWTRPELGDLLDVYGRHVAAGHWRDYALSDGLDCAVFAIFRRASEMPLYRIEKMRTRRRKQGQYVLKSMDGRVLRRGHNLAALMRFFARKNLALIEP